MAGKWVKHGLAAAGILLAAAVGFELLRAAAPPIARAGDKPDFRVSTLDGEQWSLAEHRGKGPVLVNFFATWCGPCQLEIPELVRLQKEYGDRGLKVVLLTRENRDIIRAAPNLAELPVTILVEADQAFESYGVESIPHTVYFSPDGGVAAEVPGYDPSVLEHIEQQLRKLAVRPEVEERASGP